MMAIRLAGTWGVSQDVELNPGGGGLPGGLGAQAECQPGCESLLLHRLSQAEGEPPLAASWVEEGKPGARSEGGIAISQQPTTVQIVSGRRRDPDQSQCPLPFPHRSLDGSWKRGGRAARARGDLQLLLPRAQGANPGERRRTPDPRPHARWEVRTLGLKYGYTTCVGHPVSSLQVTCTSTQDGGPAT